MGNETTKKSSQPDKNLAAMERPVPSQAEGDLETIEEDLAEKDKEASEKRS
jgi:hypothetical protein